MNTENAESIIVSGEQAGVLHIQCKRFGAEKTAELVGMRVSSPSLESLLWTLRSLKADEMTPSERAIQSRMKEGFDFKPTSEQWRDLMAACSGFSGPNSQIPGFSQRKHIDQLTGSDSCVVYPVG